MTALCPNHYDQSLQQLVFHPFYCPTYLTHQSNKTRFRSIDASDLLTL